MKKRSDRYAYYVCGFYIIFASLVTVSELSYFSGDTRLIYIGIKFALVLAGVPIFINFYRGKRTDLTTSIFFCVLILYSAWGSIFLPLYEASFFQCLIGATFLTTKRKWIYPVIHIIGGVLISATILSRHNIGFYQDRMYDYDYALVILIMVGLGILTHVFYQTEKSFRNEALLRFSALGRQTVQIAHDLKGLLGAPVLYIEDIKSKDEVKNNHALIRTLDLMAEDLEKMRSVLLSLNKMITSNEPNRDFTFSACAEKVLFLLKSRLSGVEIKIENDCRIFGQEHRLESILFNLMINSVEAFKKNKTKNPMIQISCANKKISYRDNAGSISDDVFNALQRGDSITTKHDSVGMGLTIIRHDLEHLKLSHSFERDQNGLIMNIESSNLIQI